MQKNKLGDLYAEIFRRKSVRRYDPNALDGATLDRIRAATDNAAPLTDAPAAFRVLTREQVTHPFGKAPHYLAAYARDEADSSVNAAFLLQQMHLWLSSQGIGSCWVGSCKGKGEMAAVDGLPSLWVIAFGKPDEDLRRKGAAEFKRKPLSEISDMPGMDAVLEAVRVAPSAINRQGWYLSGGEGKLRLYMADAGFIMKKMMETLDCADAGIALCHLWLAAEHGGNAVSFAKETAGVPERKKHRYVWTANLHAAGAPQGPDRV